MICASNGSQYQGCHTGLLLHWCIGLLHVIWHATEHWCIGLLQVVWHAPTDVEGPAAVHHLRLATVLSAHMPSCYNSCIVYHVAAKRSPANVLSMTEGIQLYLTFDWAPLCCHMAASCTVIEAQSKF